MKTYRGNEGIRNPAVQRIKAIENALTGKVLKEIIQMKPSTIVYAIMSLTALQNNEVRKVKPQLKTFNNVVRFLEWKSSFRLYLKIHNKDFDEGTMKIRFTYWTKDVKTGEIVETHSIMYWDLTKTKEEIINEESKPKLKNYTWREDLGGWMKNKPENPELF